ncbi:MAG TPA: NUDIX hydrolase [Candidatus Eisenbergiella stercoravium]|nr:NUDIX hydrolase [Candidatus Eisenbergiella stercoravium]
MKLLGMKKRFEGKYLHGYELTYENRAGREKTFEMVSRNALNAPSEIGTHVSGVTIVAWKDDRLLLLKEFRMSINRTIYNLCAGMLEEGESVEDCARRELYEETGLRVARFLDILPPSYSAVGFSDTATWLVFLEAEGKPRTGAACVDCPRLSENEEISADFYTREQIGEMLKTETFSSRSQTVAWFFKNGGLPGRGKAGEA